MIAQSVLVLGTIGCLLWLGPAAPPHGDGGVPAGSGVRSSPHGQRAKPSPIVRRLALNGDNIALDARAGRVLIPTATAGPHPWHLAVLDARSGSLLRTVSLPISVERLAVDEVSGRLFAPGGAGVAVLDTRSGALLRVVPLPGRVASLAVAAATGRVYVGLQQGTLLTAPDALGVLDARSGRLLRVIPLGRGHDLDALAVDERAGRVYAAGYVSKSLLVLDARTGAVRRTIRLRDGPYAVAVVAATGRVAVTGQTFLSLLDARTDRVLRTVPYGDEAITAIGRTLYVSGQDEHGYALYAFDARSGALIHRIPDDPRGQGTLIIGGPLVDAATGRLYLLTWRQTQKEDYVDGPEAVATLDRATWSLRAGPVVGQSSGTGFVVDAATRRLFALTATTAVVLDLTRL